MPHHRLPSTADILRMAREAGVTDGIELPAEVAALVAAHVLARRPPAIVVNTADLDPALLRDMLAKAPPMQLQPMPPDAALEAERAARIAAQTEVVELKERLARSGVEQRRAVREAVLAEREACAQVTKAMSDKYAIGYYGNEVDTADEIEAAIRARGSA